MSPEGDDCGVWTCNDRRLESREQILRVNPVCVQRCSEGQIGAASGDRRGKSERRTSNKRDFDVAPDEYEEQEEEEEALD